MDKFILITGGTKGIGKAVASCLGKDMAGCYEFIRIPNGSRVFPCFVYIIYFFQ
mgnify:CR=1 FL=1